MIRALLVSICAIIFYVGFQFDLLNLIQQYHTEKSAEECLKKQIRDAFSMQMILENNIVELPKLKMLLNEWQKKLIKPANLKDLLHEIAKTGEENRLQFTVFNKENKILQNHYVKIPLTLKFTGLYENILNFLVQITNMPWLITVDNFIVGDLNQPSSLSPSAEIDLEVYYNSPR